ncbi:MAG TPA: HAD family phosphatase, partial [Holophaga sp.]|nr:HAD family phosphatase [Holophaga sp.]
AELLAAHPQHEAWIQAYYGRWTEMLGGVIEGTAELLRALKARGVRVLALTNWSVETFPEARRLFPVLGEFEGIVVSGEEGIIKPDPTIYRTLCGRYQVAPERAVFIDDNPANVEAARALGMRGIHFRSPGQLGDDLRGLGLGI